MAKINIPFDNTNYSIDESAFSSASAALKSHLSSVMNGSGAVINLGGISYNVDSTKLSTATNAFVSHLGTIVGDGKKVVVGGVEYSVASAKVESAIADMHTTLGNLQSGNTGSGDEYNPNDPALNHNSIADGAYYANFNTFEFYETMPDVISEGDVYLYGDYMYTYDSNLNGWGASLATAEQGILDFIPDYPVTDRNKTSYAPILESINGKPITSLSYTFFECSALEVAPKIPNEVVLIDGAFHSCTSLTEIIIPSTVTELTSGAFYDCTNLTSIEFKGTVDEWNAIEVGDNGWNTNVPATQVVCSDGTVSLI